MKIIKSDTLRTKIKIRFQFPDDIQPIESMAPMVGWSAGN